MLRYPRKTPPLRHGQRYEWEIVDISDQMLDLDSFRVVDERTRVDIVVQARNLLSECRSLHIERQNCTLALSGFYVERGFHHDAVNVLLQALEGEEDQPLIETVLEMLLLGKSVDD